MLAIGTVIDMMYLVDQPKPGAQICLHKKCMLHKFAITIVFYIKLIISGMHHRITYMYINFQQIWVNRSVITVHTYLFGKLHKFAKTNHNFNKMHARRTPIFFRAKIGYSNSARINKSTFITEKTV